MTLFNPNFCEMSKAVLIPECNKDLGGVKGELSVSPNDKKDGAIGLLSRLLRFDALSKRQGAPGSPTSDEPPTTYYGVYIPCELKKGPDEEALHVYKTKSEALELVRRYKSARFKVFRNHQDAVSFALRGAESNEIHEGNVNSVMGEKPYPFKAPSPQDMVTLRKAIEAGLTCTVRDRVWDNPRYLVSSGNTPAIVQEGSRYNALHVAAKSLNAEICNLLLTTVGNPAFVQTLYGADAEADSCREFAAILVDRYLNTPDKAMNETPLHFAAKFGAEHVVDVLTSFPQCNKLAKNKYGEMAKDIICNRVSKANSELVRRISVMLTERYYVPVVHAEDETSPPTIGRPFTPAAPPDLNRDPLSPRFEIRAFAGPMEANDAESFRRRWKTPPRSIKPNFRLRDMSKGLEAVGRNLAEQMNVTWKEYWPFLDTFTDLRTPEGLNLLENYLSAKFKMSSYMEASPPETPLSTSKEVLSPISDLCNAMKSCNLSDRPYWSRTDPVRQRMCRQPNARPTTNGETFQMNHTVSQLLCIERTCQVFAKRIADALIFSLTAEPEVAGDSLKSEATHLHNTMLTYMDDERFKGIDFALAHWRLAQLVVFKLRQSIDSDDVSSLLEFLGRTRCPDDDVSSDDEKAHRRKTRNAMEAHVKCVSSFIAEELEGEGSKGPAASDLECADIWSKAEKCRCEWKIEMFERNSKKNASFRKNRSILSSSPKSDGFIRRLTFDQDIGDGKLQNKENVEETQNMNSPGGDNVPTVFTVDVAKCRVVDAEISDDDSDLEEAYLTAPESPDSSDDEMFDASDRPIIECFINGEEPTKIDRQVFEALSECAISSEEFPNISRWRHCVGLYSEQERESWQTSSHSDGSVISSISWSICNSPRTPLSTPGRPHTPGTPNRPLTPGSPICSTPHKGMSSPGSKEDRNPSLQVSNWLRVTGPNSPRATLTSKNVSHNVSFGF
ncbi:ankyrin repeat and LEM domain-containing protein 2 homolog [Pieris rapae]|uniref:ankyrin repeat and LEM domain-containing protein 2 homolog n=1 Tax=Pieris rapae TaxID=64459 RepID=UPI001E27D029|nr:ankyrin repeat and LEM domain-containing protein 2 homolog [Pieris rapae]